MLSRMFRERLVALNTGSPDPKIVYLVSCTAVLQRTLRRLASMWGTEETTKLASDGRVVLSRPGASRVADFEGGLPPAGYMVPKRIGKKQRNSEVILRRFRGGIALIGCFSLLFPGPSCPILQFSGCMCTFCIYARPHAFMLVCMYVCLYLSLLTYLHVCFCVAGCMYVST